MKVMGLWYPSKAIRTPTEQDYANMGRLVEEMMKAGVLESTGGWDVHGTCKVVEKSGNKVTVKDGPYSESKELVGGYGIMNVKDWDEAVKWTKRFVDVAGDGYSEMREIPAN